MTPDQAKLLLTSLLNRVASDPGRYRGLVSDQEVEALTEICALAAVRQADEPRPNAARHLPPLLSPPQLALKSVSAPVENPDVVLCIDFGTAKSKSFAARDTGEGDPDLFDLAIGDLDKDIDGSVFSAASALWIDESGLIFVGSESIKRSELSATEGRARIESLKQFISQSNGAGEVRSTTLTLEEDPFRSGMTHEQALLLYLGYLTDLSVSCLETKGLSRLTRRRFAMPCWEPAQRAWASEYLGSLVARAQIVADTFSGRWQAGIGVREAMAVCDATRQHAEALRHLVDEAPDANTALAQRWGGVLEPIASASARMHSASDVDRRLMLVADIGAGTTDVALFWLVQDDRGRRAFPVAGTMRALRMAGDHLDHILLKMLLQKGNIEPRLERRAETKLRLEGLRGLKERLYQNGSVSTRLINDALVEVTRDEFEGSQPVLKFREQLADLVKGVVADLDPSWALQAERITLVLSGGGATLPAASDLTNVEASVGDHVARFRLAPLVPDNISSGLKAEYPRLAVALGGALHGIGERAALDRNPSGSPQIGQLERSQNRGI